MTLTFTTLGLVLIIVPITILVTMYMRYMCDVIGAGYDSGEFWLGFIVVLGCLVTITFSFAYFTS